MANQHISLISLTEYHESQRDVPDITDEPSASFDRKVAIVAHELRITEQLAEALILGKLSERKVKQLIG